MPGLYLGVIVLSYAGVALLARRFLPGTLGRGLVRATIAVLLVFLSFDALGSARGWFASSRDWVVAIVAPGIPLEEPLLLAFLALFAVVVLGLARRALDETDRVGTAAAPLAAPVVPPAAVTTPAPSAPPAAPGRLDG